MRPIRERDGDEEGNQNIGEPEPMEKALEIHRLVT